jgi:hypothetical protein
MSVSDYMATRLWQPLGAEADATWNLDSERSGFEKMESGLNATPVDYARFGQLLLHNGEWNGTRIVSKSWVRAATAVETDSDPADFYQYFWWVDVERSGRFYALGNYGQYPTWPPTPTPSSSASVATGASTTTPGWPPSVASPTNWPIDRDPPGWAYGRRGRGGGGSGAASSSAERTSGSRCRSGRGPSRSAAAWNCRLVNPGMRWRALARTRSHSRSPIL